MTNHSYETSSKQANGNTDWLGVLVRDRYVYLEVSEEQDLPGGKFGEDVAGISLGPDQLRELALVLSNAADDIEADADRWNGWENREPATP